MNAQAIQSDWVGQVIDGRFTLLQWLGGSERGGVFLTELPGPQARKAVIKLIPAEDAEAYLAGWDATRTLSHPHLMRLFHTGRCQSDEGELLYSVAEYADELLSEILPERALTITEAKEMLAPVIDTLFYLHGKGLVHGHLKPSNVMVVDDRLKLSGDSLQVAGETGRRASVQNIYDAPEAAAGTISAAADVWGLGVTLVEALTQHPPAWDRAADEDPAVPESIPQPFAGIARECLRADPMGRCTLGNVKIWLETGQFHREPTVKISEKKPVGNRVFVPVAAAIVLVGVIGVFIVHSHQDQPPSLPASAQADAQQQASAVAPTPQPAQEQAPEAAVASSQTAEQAASAAQAPPPQAPAPATQVSNGPPGKVAVAEQVMPDVLPAARESIQGKVNVRVRVTVGPGGDVSNATFDSEGPSRYFSKVALDAARRWKFKPAKANGQAAPSVWILQFQFTRAGTDVTPVAAH